MPAKAAKRSRARRMGAARLRRREIKEADSLAKESASRRCTGSIQTTGAVRSQSLEAVAAVGASAAATAEAKPDPAAAEAARATKAACTSKAGRTGRTELAEAQCAAEAIEALGDHRGKEAGVIER